MEKSNNLLHIRKSWKKNVQALSKSLAQTFTRYGIFTAKGIILNLRHSQKSNEFDQSEHRFFPLCMRLNDRKCSAWQKTEICDTVVYEMQTRLICNIGHSLWQRCDNELTGNVIFYLFRSGK